MLFDVVLAPFLPTSHSIPADSTSGVVDRSMCAGVAGSKMIHLTQRHGAYNNAPQPTHGTTPYLLIPYTDAFHALVASGSLWTRDPERRGPTNNQR